MLQPRLRVAGQHAPAPRGGSGSARPARCASAFSRCANWRQLPTPSCGRRDAPHAAACRHSARARCSAALGGVEQVEGHAPVRAAGASQPWASARSRCAAQQHQVALACSNSSFKRVRQSRAAARGCSAPAGTCWLRLAWYTWGRQARHQRHIHGRSASAFGAAEAHRRMTAEQVAQHLQGHARRGPGRDVARRDDAGIGEAGSAGHGRWRSKTVTSWPSPASSYALVTPTMPAPMTAMRMVSAPRRGQGGLDGQRHVEHRDRRCIAPAQTIRPTGSSSGAWQGSDSAQPSRWLTTDGLRSSSALVAKKGLVVDQQRLQRRRDDRHRRADEGVEAVRQGVHLRRSSVRRACSRSM